ncbi:MAG TPA: cation transporter [Candidatus Acidoferrum sp.]|jgi:divalent metal cation (Fe/Co/Zn/Cd) transporter
MSDSSSGTATSEKGQRKKQRKNTRKGKKLEYFTIAWNALEAGLAIYAGITARSVSMVGFGADSFIEVISGGAVLWRMSITHEDPRRQRRERIALRIVSVCLLALAGYIALESTLDLVHKQKPETSKLGIVLASASIVVMPLLSKYKKKVGENLRSPAMSADARQTQFSLYMSIIVLAGLVANAVLGWWWADPVAALAMVPLIAKEGWDNFCGKM